MKKKYLVLGFRHNSTQLTFAISSRILICTVFYTRGKFHAVISHTRTKKSLDLEIENNKKLMTSKTETTNPVFIFLEVAQHFFTVIVKPTKIIKDLRKAST